MATEKLEQILRVRSDFTDAQIASMTDGEAWNWIYQQDKARKLEKYSRHEICFTGFSLSERERLEAKAQAHGLSVKESVTKSLRYLCAGPSAGPSKLAKAQKQGVLIFSAESFSRFCDTGEIPPDVLAD